jgi:hypothetical protein
MSVIPTLTLAVYKFRKIGRKLCEIYERFILVFIGNTTPSAKGISRIFYPTLKKLSLMRTLLIGLPNLENIAAVILQQERQVCLLDFCIVRIAVLNFIMPPQKALKSTKSFTVVRSIRKREVLVPFTIFVMWYSKKWC